MIKEKPVVIYYTRFWGLNELAYTLGTAYIAAYLESKGVGCALLPRRSIDMISGLEMARRNRPLILGLTTYDQTYNQTKCVARTAKKMMPEVLIVAGGPTPTFSSEVVLTDCPEIDIAVRGEGEYTMYDLFRYTQGEMALEEIPGISYRRGEEIIHNPDRPLINIDGPRGAELDILPSPYESGILTGLEFGAGIQSSRGCVYRCTFCNGPMMFGFRVRFQSVERVLYELRIISENLGKHAMGRRVDLWDDNFCLDRARTRRLCEGIINEGLRLYLSCQIRADRVTKELLDLMYEAGIRVINFGLESAVPRVLRNIKKANGKSPDFREEKKYIEDIKWAVSYCKKIGINPNVSVMIGLPGETPEDARTTMKVVEDLGVDLFYTSRLSIFKGTELYDDHERFGIKIRRTPEIFPLETIHPYDVSKIKIPLNCYLYHHAFDLQRRIEDVIFGWWANDPLEIEALGPYLVLEDFHEITPEMIRWFQKIMKFNSVLTLLYRNTEFSISAVAKMQLYMFWDIPTHQVCVIHKSKRKLPEGVEFYILKVPTGFKNSFDFSYQYKIVPFKYAKNGKRRGVSSPVLLYSTRDEDDIESLKFHLGGFAANFEKAGIGRLLRQNAAVEDACRFRPSMCPATKPGKLHIRRDGTISPCLFGGEIGRIGDSLEKIRKRVMNMISDVEKERGCSECSAKDICPRCLFPYPLSSEEYCSLVRNSFIPYNLEKLTLLHNFELKRKMGFHHYTKFLPGIRSIPEWEEEHAKT